MGLRTVAFIMAFAGSSVPYGDVSGDRATAAAAGQTAAKPATVVALTQSTGAPGGIVGVPVQFTGGDAVAAGVLTVKVRYPPGKLTFSKLELGGVAASVDAVAEAKARALDGDMVVDVTISTPLKDGKREALLDGPLAQLLFRVGKDEKPQTVIPLKVEATVAGLMADAPATKAPSRDGEVIVSNPVVISCFFYMH